MPRHHTLDFDSKGFAILTLNEEGRTVNILSSEVLNELTQTVQRLHAMKQTKGLLIRSAKPKQFIAGANIDEIAAITVPSEAEHKAAYGQALMNGIESLPFPSVAAIDGPCLGGGLELALACTYRVVGEGSHVKLGLPEVKLGIIPGFGGTQRMPRIIGMVNSLEMILKGKVIDGMRAFKMGLSDDIAASEILEDVAQEWLFRAPKLKRPTKISLRNRLIEKTPPLRKLAYKKAREATLKETKGFYPAPLAAIDVLEETYGMQGEAGYAIEAKRVGDLVINSVSKSLIRIFDATEQIRREKMPEAPKPVSKVGLIGAGVMGGGIAQLVSSKGKSVRLRDISMDALNKAMRVVAEINGKEVKRKKISKREAYSRTTMIAPTTDLTGFKRADLVIEAVVENMNVKKKVFQELSGVVRFDTILATNTSALSITEIATAAEHPDRVIGLHFFNPVHKMPLVEIIKGRETSSQTVSTTLAFALAIGKTPIVVADRPGFLVNRLLGLYLNEAALAAEEGVPVAAIEQAMKDFGMPMGPFELMDEIGLDIAEEVGNYLKKSFAHFPAPSALIPKVKQLGRLGKKNGEGFYLHRGNEKTLDEKTIASLVTSSTQTETNYAKLVDRFVLLMVNEAVRCLEEGVVSSPRDIDIGMIFGTGFAPFRGGLLAYANYRSLPDVEISLEELAAKHGDRFKPVQKIRDFAIQGKVFE